MLRKLIRLTGALIALVALTALIGATPAFAGKNWQRGPAPFLAPTDPPPDVLADQQDVTTDGTGSVTLRFDQGDETLGAGNDTCMSSTPIVVFQLARTLTPGKAQPVTWRAGQNTACSIRLTLLNGAGVPITNAQIRVAYIATVKGGFQLDPSTITS